MTKLGGLPAGSHKTWDNDIIYSESSCHINDLYYEGSEDEEYEDSVTRIRRYERAGRHFLGGSSPFLLSVTLKGSLDSPSGCANPWIANRSEAIINQAKGAIRTNEKAALHNHASNSRSTRESTLKPSLTECHLPSPESLKQAPYTRSHPYLEADGFDEVKKWRDTIGFSPLNKDSSGALNNSESLSPPRKRRTYEVEWLKKTPVKKRRSNIQRGWPRQDLDEVDELTTVLSASPRFGDMGQTCSPSQRISPRSELRRVKRKTQAGSDDELSPNKAAAASLSSPVSLHHVPNASFSLENKEPFDPAKSPETRTTPSRSPNPKICDASYLEDANCHAASNIAPPDESTLGSLLKMALGDEGSEVSDGKSLYQATGSSHLHDDTTTLEDDQDTMSEDTGTQHVPKPFECKSEPKIADGQGKLIRLSEAPQFSHPRPQHGSLVEVEQASQVSTFNTTTVSNFQPEDKHIGLPKTLAGDSQLSSMAAAASAILSEQEKDTATSDQANGVSGEHSVDVHRRALDAEQDESPHEMASPNVQPYSPGMNVSLLDGTVKEDDKNFAFEANSPPNYPGAGYVSLLERTAWSNTRHAFPSRNPFEILSPNLLEPKPLSTLSREKKSKRSKADMHGPWKSSDEPAEPAGPSIRSNNETEDYHGYDKPASPRANTPEPLFCVKPFASFMSPSPHRSRRNRRLSASKLCSQNSRPTLKSALKTQWSRLRPDAHVSWAISVDTRVQSPESGHQRPSMLISTSVRRQGSPPPDTQTGELPATHDTKFSKHFEAVAGRADNSRQWVLATASQREGNCGPSAMAGVVSSADTAVDESEEAIRPNNKEDVQIPESRYCDRRSEEPMDIVEDMFREMGEFWEPWNIDAELEQARKSGPTISARPL